MGGGGWDVGTYARTNAANAAAGKSTFDYDAQVKSGKASTVNPLLDPKKPAGAASPFAGRVMREVCITDEHPDPTAITVWLDVTGSNYTAAMVVHQKLPKLQAYLRDGKFCNDPQVNVSAIGDANSDDYPLQFGQFESDNRLDKQIAAIILEGNGGGQARETYELGAYMSARHVHMEPYELYGKKGFVFFIGDELPYMMIRNDFRDGRWYHAGHTMQSLTGDTLQESLDTAAVFAELMEKNHVFFLFQKQGSYSASEVVPTWQKLIGAEHVVELDDPATVVEVVAALIARFEGGLGVDDITSAMLKAGGSVDDVKKAGKVVARMGTPGTAVGKMAKTSGVIKSGKGKGADRL